MSSFFGRERPAEDVRELLSEADVLMRELSWEVKERVVDEEISLPRLMFRGRCSP